MRLVDFWKKRRVVICGGQGFLGGQVMRRLVDLRSDAISCSRRAGTDLRDLDQGIGFFRMHEPEVVINCAANQGGIAYQKLYPGSIYYDNLLMGANTMEAARLAGVKKYVNIIAGCAYPGEPRDGVLREEEFEAGPMHPTVENYGATKRAAVLQAKYYRRQYGFDAISLILVNLYGPSEHFHPDRSHALAALIRKFYEAKRDRAPEVVLWGTGRAVREWMYVNDAADGIVRASERYAEAEPLNLAVGHGQTIAELANIIKAIVRYEGRIVYDSTMPDGALQKVGDTTRMRAMLDWEPQVPILEGIKRTLDWFAAHYEEACGR
jgi:GDP-L-fucose synthase